MKKQFQIVGVRLMVKPDKKGNPREIVLIKGKGADDFAFLTKKQFDSLGYGSQPHAAIGSTINLQYFKIDEDMLNGAKCTAEGKILKEYSIEFSAQDLLLMKAAAFGAKVSIN